MSGLHWFPFYWDDYSTKTMHLSQGQHGAYILLLRWIYTTNSPVPDKQRYSIAQARLKGEIENVDAILSQFFRLEDGGWVNSKAAEVMAESEERHRKFAAAGRAGGLKRSSRAQASLKPASSNYNHTQKDKEVSKKEATPPAQLFVLPDFIPGPAWDDFIEMRRKTRKPPTEKAKALLARSLEKLMTAGHDPAEILNQSTLNGWTDIYPIKNKENGNGRGQKSREATTLDKHISALASLHSRYGAPDAGNGTEGDGPEG